MKKAIMMLLMNSFLVLIASISFSASMHEAHHKGGESSSPSCMMGPNMMGPNMMGPNMMGPNMMGPNMMGPNMMGPNMMDCRKEHLFFLGQAKELELSEKQIAELKTIHSDCRKENIRTAAEVKIVRLELAELLASDDWSLKDAEDLVRKAQKLEADIQVRHLQAFNAARKVLTKEQLDKARSGGGVKNLEDLFQ
ncbi:hypothetical protein [Malonomonas rubra]|uniref:hypothetical protein n=1 Tax=Malonomonas rubra TaxID=57040 RepID=UPI0026F1284D|nr:hypothetical protein [Malonomonas rubra]